MLALIMEGVTTAIVLGVLIGVARPEFVKNRRQFYCALGAVLGIIVLDAAAHALGSASLTRAVYGFIGLLQIFGVLSLVLSGSEQDVKDTLGGAIEVIRRGEEEKEIIIPRSARPPGDPTRRA